VVTAFIGAAAGYANLSLITWSQHHIPPPLMGRVVSFIGLGAMALVPVSQVVAGAAVAISLEAMLVVAGVGMAAVALAGACSTSARRMGLEPLTEPATAA